jgi:hypothetical protein
VRKRYVIFIISLFVVFILGIFILAYRSFTSPCAVTIRIENKYGSTIQVSVYDTDGKEFYRKYNIKNNGYISFTDYPIGLLFFDIPINENVLIYSEYDHWFASNHDERIIVQNKSIDLFQTSMNWRRNKEMHYHLK